MKASMRLKIAGEKAHLTETAGKISSPSPLILFLVSFSSTTENPFTCVRSITFLVANRSIEEKNKGKEIKPELHQAQWG